MRAQLDELLANFVKKLNLEAAAVVDHSGLIIHSVFSPTIKDDEEQIGGVTAVVDSLLDRIKAEFGGKSEFQNIINLDSRKFCFISAGSDAIVTTLSGQDTDDGTLQLYGKHVAGKVSKLLSGEGEVTVSFPPILDALSKFRGGKLPKGNYAGKVVVCGDYSVGKSSLIRRFVENKFQDGYISTLGVDISRKSIDLSDSCEVSILCWDVAGQRSSFEKHRLRFYSGANAAFIVFDKTRPDSFDGIDFWLDDIKKNLRNRLPVILVGNKNDLPEKVTSAQLAQKAEDLGFYYTETSAKTGDNVEAMFVTIAHEIVRRA